MKIICYVRNKYYNCFILSMTKKTSLMVICTITLLLGIGSIVPMIPQATAAPPTGTGVWLSSTNAPPDLAHMLSPREGTCADFNSALVDGVSQDRIYVSAGYGFNSAGAFVGDNNILDAYDIDTDTWVPLTAAPTSRSEGAGASQDGLFYCIGGRFIGVLSTNEVYDPSTDAWATLSPMPTARAGLGVVDFADKIYALGGRTGAAPNGGTPLATLEVYDIATDSWSTLSPMPTARGDLTAVASHGGQIYAAGGWNPACGASGACNNLEVYDIASDTWSTLTPMPTARSNAAGDVAGNNLFVIGGFDGFVGNLDVNEVYNISKGTWSTATPKTSPCSESEGVGHGNKIFVIGCGIFGAANGYNEAFLVNTFKSGIP